MGAGGGGGLVLCEKITCLLCAMYVFCSHCYVKFN